MIEMFYSAYCPYCTRAKALLESKGVALTIFDVNEDPMQAINARKRSGLGTVPQIFINGNHIGGCDDLQALEDAGKLDALLKA
ncbi:glutaredoxin 3 [Gammaproteobacteria bacterium]|nr:glutaredoxin 3 [Gammaproteobacteria bacterium]